MPEVPDVDVWGTLEERWRARKRRERKKIRKVRRAEVLDMMTAEEEDIVVVWLLGVGMGFGGLVMAISEFCRTVRSSMI